MRTAPPSAFQMVVKAARGGVPGGWPQRGTMAG